MFLYPFAPPLKMLVCIGTPSRCFLHTFPFSSFLFVFVKFLLLLFASAFFITFISVYKHAFILLFNASRLPFLKTQNIVLLLEVFFVSRFSSLSTTYCLLLFLFSPHTPSHRLPFAHTQPLPSPTCNTHPNVRFILFSLSFTFVGADLSS